MAYDTDMLSHWERVAYDTDMLYNVTHAYQSRTMSVSYVWDDVTLMSMRASCTSTCHSFTWSHGTMWHIVSFTWDNLIHDSTSSRTYDTDILHINMSHVMTWLVHMKPCPMCHSLSFTSLLTHSHENVSHHTHERVIVHSIQCAISCHENVYLWVMSHLGMSHVPLVNESWHTH